jgi:hypothetical protein
MCRIEQEKIFWTDGLAFRKDFKIGLEEPLASLQLLVISGLMQEVPKVLSD